MYSLDSNFGAKIAFWVHLDLHFGVRVCSHALLIIVEILQNSIFDLQTRILVVQTLCVLHKVVIKLFGCMYAHCGCYL